MSKKETLKLNWIDIGNDPEQHEKVIDTLLENRNVIIRLSKHQIFDADDVISILAFVSDCEEATYSKSQSTYREDGECLVGDLIFTHENVKIVF